MGTITLPNVPATSDITAKVRLKYGGMPIDFRTLYDIKAWVYSDAQKALAGRCVTTIEGEEGEVLSCLYTATKPQYLGPNRIIVQAKYHGQTNTYDKLAFNIVRRLGDVATEVVEVEDNDAEVAIEVDVTIEITEVSAGILDRGIAAAFDAADKAEHAASLVPLQVLQDCEQATEEAQDATEAADEAAEHATPYIGENGHWWRWSKEAGEYIDTGEVAQGPTGNGIQSVEQTAESQESEGENVVTVTMTDGTQAQFTIRNGKQGERGLQGIPGASNAKYKQVDTLPEATAATMEFIYLTPSQTAGVYDMSYTEQDGNTYTWKPMGTTAIQLSDYTTKAEFSLLQQEVDGFVSSFPPVGWQQPLSAVIPAGSVIESITGGTWSSVNLYDADGQNQLRLTPSMLPYMTSIEYAKGSTYIDGVSSLDIHVSGIKGDVETLKTNVASISGSISSVPGSMDAILRQRAILQLIQRGTKEYFKESKASYANLSGLAVGSTFSLVATPSANYTYELLDVQEGDVIILTTAGNTENALAYAIMDENDVILALSQTVPSNTVLVMPSGAAKIVANTMVSGTVYRLSYIMGKTRDYDNAYKYLAELLPYNTSFIANGVVNNLTKPIQRGAIIRSISSASVNLYDAEGNNQIRLTPANLPYKCLVDYYKGSTYIDGTPVVVIGVESMSLSDIVLNTSDTPSTLDTILTMKGVLKLIRRFGKDYFVKSKGGYANFSGLSVGGIFTLNFSYTGMNGYTFEDIPVQGGDVIILTTAGNTENAPAYAIMDGNDTILSIVQPNQNNAVILIPAGGARFVSNTYIVGANYAMTHISGKSDEYDATVKRVLETVSRFVTTFVASGIIYPLTKMIPAGCIIEDISSQSINLYDENGENRITLTRDSLPFVTGRDYYKGSTYIEGLPTVEITVSGRLLAAGAFIDADKYGIGNRDNDFSFDRISVGQLAAFFLQLRPNWNIPTNGVFFSTDVENVTRLTAPVTDEQLLKAYTPYIYVNGEKRGTIVLFDADGTPYIYDRSGNKRFLNLQ